MTTKDKAEEIAIRLIGDDRNYTPLVDVLIEMAEWKDKQFAKEKQQFIKKVCEWLDKNIPLYEDLNEKVWGDMARRDLLKDLKNEIKNYKKKE